jgi:hypothetical protein
MTNSKWIRIAFALAVVFLMGAAQTAPPQPTDLPVGSAVVAEIKGEVKFTSPEGAPVTVQRGSTLTADSKIETAKGSVLLALQDGSQVLVKSHANVVLRSPNQGNGFSLELFLGEILVKVKKRTGEAPSFRMGTPSAVITVRGTRFTVEVNKKQRTYVDVFEGLVEVEGVIPGSKRILIRPGFYSGVDQDRSPSEPRESSPGAEGNGNSKDNGREGQNQGTDRNSGDQQNKPPKQGAGEGKPD